MVENHPCHTKMRSIAQQLISAELRTNDSSDAVGRAAIRVCEKLRRPLSTFAGTAGFRALLVRALVLAKAEAPWLAELTVAPDGSIPFSVEFEAKLDREDAAKGGITLLSHVISLLITFIGEASTLRLIHNVWPNAVLGTLESGDSI